MTLPGWNVGVAICNKYDNLAEQYGGRQKIKQKVYKYNINRVLYIKENTDVS